MDATPKVMRYADAVADAESRIVAALPDIIEALVARAKDGDARAAVYLLDRVLGRPAGTKHPPAEDKSLPYDADDLASDIRSRRQNRELSNLLASVGGG